MTRKTAPIVRPPFRPEWAPAEEPYTCPELGRNPGLCDSRFEAYKLPSRMGNRLVEPKRQYGDPVK